MRSGRFSTHGSVELSVDERILIVEGAGPWNLEAIQEADRTYAPLIDTLAGQPWGALVVLHGDPIYVPDAAEYLVQAVKKECSQGRVATAILVEDSNSPEFAKRHLSDIYGKAGCEHRFFASEDDASWWLIQKITSARGE